LSKRELLDQFDEATRQADRAAMIELLEQVEFDSDAAAKIADKILD
jgi:hypothetical protein